MSKAALAKISTFKKYIKCFFTTEIRRKEQNITFVVSRPDGSCDSFWAEQLVLRNFLYLQTFFLLMNMRQPCELDILRWISTPEYIIWDLWDFHFLFVSVKNWLNNYSTQLACIKSWSRVGPAVIPHPVRSLKASKSPSNSQGQCWSNNAIH